MSAESIVEAARAPGRPPKFSHGDVVASAMDVFWRQGYDGTSLGDLEDAARINRSTLYASFDGKAGLYEAAVDSYVQIMEELLVTPMIEGSDGLADLVVFAQRLRTLLTDPTKPDGCLIVNAMGSGRPPESMNRYLTNLRAGFDAALSRAVRRGEISEAGNDEKASSLLSSAVGLNVIAKSGSPSKELHRLCRGVEAMIEGWREPLPV